MVENNIIRMFLNFLFTLLAGAIVLFVTRILLGLHMQVNWLDEVLRAVGNAVIGLVLFPVLDLTQLRD